jgi:hypothetical protein
VGIEDKIKETERLIELVRLGIVNFPKEVVIPSIGYYCLIGREEDDSSQLRQPPVIFDYYKHLSNAQIALGKTSKIIEGLN